MSSARLAPCSPPNPAFAATEYPRTRAWEDTSTARPVRQTAGAPAARVLLPGLPPPAASPSSARSGTLGYIALGLGVTGLAAGLGYCFVAPLLITPGIGTLAVLGGASLLDRVALRATSTWVRRISWLTACAVMGVGTAALAPAMLMASSAVLAGTAACTIGAGIGIYLAGTRRPCAVDWDNPFGRLSRAGTSANQVFATGLCLMGFLTPAPGALMGVVAGYMIYTAGRDLYRAGQQTHALPPETLAIFVTNCIVLSFVGASTMLRRLP